MPSCCCPSAGRRGPSRCGRSWRTSLAAAASRRSGSTTVAEHYLHFGGVSPINGINRALIAQLEPNWPTRPRLPVYFGNRNWEPYVEDTVAAMRDDGIRRAAVFTTSAWGGYSSCAQYIEDIARGRAAAGDGAPELVKLRQYFDHPLFVEMFADGDRRRRRRRCPPTCAPTRGWCSPRTRFRCGRGPAAARTSTAARSPTRRGWSRRRRATPTTTRCGSRGRARRRCRGWNPMWPTISRRWPTRHQGRHRLPDRVRRRPHRGGVGPGQRTACSRPTSAASRSPARPPPMPTAASRGWRST